MTIRMMSGTLQTALHAGVLALGAPGAVSAQQRGHGDFAGRVGGAHQHFDARFSHNHYYFDRGYTRHEAFSGGYPIDFGRDHYWFDGGQWYRRGDFGCVVMGAPLGAFVSILPPFYTTVWVGGVPYYYANDTYYSWLGDRQAYEVVMPPDTIGSAGTTQPPPSPAIFVYPKNGQSSQQQATDRYECHHAAVEQTGYDPTREGGGVPAEVAAAKRTDYFRVAVACLDARGYSVK
jgi:uncharacterized protein DUF6515